VKFEVDAGQALITGAIGVGENDGATGDGSFNDVGVIIEVPELGPVDFEAFYLAEDDPDWKGRLGADVKVVGTLPMVDVAAGFVYDLTDAAGTDTATDYIEEWAFGIGASLEYSMATIGVALDGNDRDTLNRLDIDGKIDMGGYGLQGALSLSFAADDIAGTTTKDESDSFQGAEIGVFLEVNVATWKAGYVITDNDYSYASAISTPEGGFFITADIDL
jgi:hypothetical protein